MQIVILGGGISGLSAAWYAQKKYPSAKISLIEKSHRLGGWVETRKENEAYIEMGPRSFAMSRSSALLELIEEVGLHDELLYSSKEATQRYLLQEGELKALRSFYPMIAKALLKEALTPAHPNPNESIYEYTKRRFGHAIAEQLVDPMTLGIYAGDIRKLSLAACFPFLHDLEKKKHSLLRTLLFGKKGDHRLFTLKRGMESLIDALKQKLNIEVHLNTAVEGIRDKGVWVSKHFFEADLILSAVPQQALQGIVASPIQIKANSLWTVHMGFAQDVLDRKGFGYLVPSKERQQLLGMVFDSAIFHREPQGYRTILTAMIRNEGDMSWAKGVALEGVRRHLGCLVSPEFIEAHLKFEAIPQYERGHFETVSLWKEELARRFPRLKIVGNYLEGASVDACVRVAKQAI